MLTLLIFIVIAAGAAYILSRSHQTPKVIDKGYKPNAENFRSLFEPTDDELRELDRSMALRSAQLRFDEAEAELQRRIGDLDRFSSVWGEVTSKQNTLELITLASRTESGKIYLETAKQVIHKWREGQIAGLSAGDLAQLLESQYWLLPVAERTSGVNFSLKDEIAGLHRMSEKH
jgi:hypothetical protein